MNIPQCLTQYSWNSAEFPLCCIDVPADELASRLGFPLAKWEEDGLGAACGFLCRLTSGQVLLIEELEHARQHLGAKGPTIYVEAGELVECGVDRLLVDCITGLGLSQLNITWLQTELGLQGAQQILQHLRGKLPAQNGG